MSAGDTDRKHREDSSAPEQKTAETGAPGAGDSIPSSGDGVGIGAGTEPNTFEPEEEPEAAEDNAKSSAGPDGP